MSALDSLTDERLEQVASGNLGALPDDILEAIVSEDKELNLPPVTVDGAVALSKRMLQPADLRDVPLGNRIPFAEQFLSGFFRTPKTVASTSFDFPGRLASGVQAGLMREEVPSDAGIPEQAGEFIGRTGPIFAAGAVAAPFTGGMSIPAAFGAEALALGAGEAGSQILARIIGGNAPNTAGEAANEILGVGLSGAATGGVFKASGHYLRSLKPSLVKLGAQIARTFSGVPEKYGRAVLNNPAILSEAPTLEAARAIYRDAIRGVKGAREFLLEQSGDLIMSSGDAVGMVNGAFKKLGGELSLDEALAARQATSFLLQAAKFGNPEQRANLSNLLRAKDAFDEFLESSLPVFKDASRKYFEANAADAFRSLLPQNKNLSPNVLRGLGGLSMLAAGAVKGAPALILGALPMSPFITGIGIRAGARIGDVLGRESTRRVAQAASVRAVQTTESETKASSRSQGSRQSPEPTRRAPEPTRRAPESRKAPGEGQESKSRPRTLREARRSKAAAQAAALTMIEQDEAFEQRKREGIG